MSDRTAAPTLRSVSNRWFLFLSTFRRRAASMPADPEWARGRLDRIWQEMETDARRDPRVEVKLKTVEHALVYVADEILLDCGWAGEMAWSNDLLESRRYGTQHGGQDFYAKLDAAMNQDDVEILEVYHRALCLGFKGRMVKQKAALDELRVDVFRRLPAETVEDARFCPEAYLNVDEREFVKLPVVAVARILIGLLAFLVMVYVAADLTFDTQLEELDKAAEDAVNRLYKR